MGVYYVVDEECSFLGKILENRRWKVAVLVNEIGVSSSSSKEFGSKARGFDARY